MKEDGEEETSKGRDIGEEILEGLQEAVEWAEGRTKTKVTQWSCGVCGVSVKLEAEVYNHQLPLVCDNCQECQKQESSGEGVEVENPQTKMTELVLPSMTNGHGTLFGGKALEMMDKAAAVVALRHARKDVVTAAMDQVSFEAPIHESDIIEVVATIVRTGTTSMIVDVEVFGEKPKTGEKTRCTKAEMTMVAVDENGKPTEVPSLE